MDPRTGHIHFDMVEEEIQRRKLVEIPRDQLEQVVNMNRKARRAWAAEQRRKKG